MAANPILLEISVQTVEAAVAAQRGGAQRIELCADLRLGGLTPAEELIGRVRELVTIPVFAMIRPRAGDFVYSGAELTRMRSDIEMAKALRVDGIVCGVLGRDRTLDIEHTRELVEIARPLPVTFHRAFDGIVDLEAALEDVIDTGAARILTSGGAATAPTGIESLATLVAAARDRIVIIPAGGINAFNVLQVARETGARELHSGLGSVMAYGEKDYARFESEVRKLAAQLARVT